MHLHLLGLEKEGHFFLRVGSVLLFSGAGNSGSTIFLYLVPSLLTKLLCLHEVVGKRLLSDAWLPIIIADR